MGAAVQAFFTYPETCGKTLEEIVVLFRKEGPHPWNTKPGRSRLNAKIEAVIDRKRNLNVPLTDAPPRTESSNEKDDVVESTSGATATSN